MQTYLHLTGFHIIHGGSEFIVGYKTVVRRTEAFKKLFVFGLDAAVHHADADDCSGKERNQKQNFRPEEKDNQKNSKRNEEAADSNGDRRISVGVNTDEIFFGGFHLFDRRISYFYVENELANEKICPEPTAA